MVSKLGFEIAIQHLTNSVTGKLFDDPVVVVPCACRVDMAQVKSINVVAKEKKFKFSAETFCPCCNVKAKAYYEDPSTAKASKEYSKQMQLIPSYPGPRAVFSFRSSQDGWIFYNTNSTAVIDACTFNPVKKTFSVQFRESKGFEEFLLANDFIQTDHESRFAFYGSKNCQEARKLLVNIIANNDFPADRAKLIFTALE